jgi:predicted DNA-binding transcriptional regulator AlpA
MLAHKPPEGFLTVPDFLNTYAVSRTGFYREVARGNIRVVKIGRSSRIARADAQRWAASLPTVGGEE